MVNSYASALGTVIENEYWSRKDPALFIAIDVPYPGLDRLVDLALFTRRAGISRGAERLLSL